MAQQGSRSQSHTVPQMLQEAARAWNELDYSRCFAILETAHRCEPTHLGVLLELGRANGLRFEFAKAQEWFERAVAAAPAANKSDVLAMAAFHARNYRRYETATQYLERAANDPNATPDTLMKLAELYERIRKLDDATNLVDRALSRDPKNAFALLVRSRLDRLAGRVEQAETTLRSFLSETNPNDWSTRVRGWYELGAVLDKQARYDDAMSAFVTAKKMILPNAPAHIATLHAVRAHMKQAGEQITSDMLKRWFDAGPSLRPAPRRLALLCGHPRSGTTLLEQVLDSHPDIISAEETDILNFEAYCPLKRAFPPSASVASVLDAASPGALRQSREDYFRYMERFLDQPVGQRVLIDKNPSLTTFPPIAIRIFPEMKFIVALRDPRDVCLSCFMQPMPLNPITSAYLTLEDTAIEYAAVMGLWRTFAPRMANPHLEIRYEDVVADLEGSARRALDFLGVDWDPRVLGFNQHASQKLVRSPTYADVTKPISKGAVGRWRNYQKYLEPVLERLAPFVNAFAYK